MILSDFHIHTYYCDGKNSPEDIVQEALKRGMKKLGFSGHSYTAFDTEPCMSPENTQRYRDEIRGLKDKYGGQIEILCGTEQDYYSDMPTDEYDYVIGSVHYVQCGGEYIHVDHTPEMLRNAVREYFDGDTYALAEAYYDVAADVVNRTGADIIGHFDLLTKFNEIDKLFDEDNPRYITACNRAIDTLLKTGKPFEINTGAMSRGYRTTPYPSKRILQYIASHEGRVILSSDAHDKNNLMYKFPECERLAHSLGLNIVEL